MSQVPHRILLVDDEPSIVKALFRSLRQGTAEGLWPALQVETFTDPEAALARSCEQHFDLVISDYRMPGMSGARLLAQLRELQPHCRRVILSGYTDSEGLLAAINEAQITRFFTKPWNERELLYGVRALLQEQKSARETEILAEQQRLAQGDISPQEAERRRLERLEPGITKVQWSDDGAYVLDPMGQDSVWP
ncbi:MAG: response regulator [Roseateles asaccharophilus]|jgi:response regulator RpfG family c-di-GMP phosphodiesterase|uniref:Response regulator receiver domain-containing protein n=1 Tax=Roseateles asaccharophilus TaxID=582607 RepID=A0A4R6NEA2_9BURK|nr:response regulator [Roseateles asaccharophilus]MDN3542916.1 response regulator [Roseateles asaccharophilus]TDP13385.1 response regulator receiver domain-containing protein [Roseateles asaccharophilus]